MEDRGLANERHDWRPAFNQALEVEVVPCVDGGAARHSESNDVCLEFLTGGSSEEFCFSTVTWVRPSTFDVLDPQRAQVVCDPQFLLNREIHCDGLAAVSERSIVDSDKGRQSILTCALRKRGGGWR